MIVGIVTVLQEPFICMVTSCQPVGTFMNDKIFQIKDIVFVPFKNKAAYSSTDQSDCEKILDGIRTNILNDNFYFCYKENLTLTYDKKMMNPEGESSPCKKYFWNEDLLKVFHRHKLEKCWQVPILQGYISEIYCKLEKFEMYYLHVSRRSKFMSGVRSTTMGVDHNFNTANFV